MTKRRNQPAEQNWGFGALGATDILHVAAGIIPTGKYQAW